MDDEFDDYFTEEGRNLLKLDNDPEYEAGAFFRSNLRQVRESLSPSEFRKFTELEDDSSRVAFILSIPLAHELPLEVDNDEFKDPMATKDKKESGNAAFSLQHYPVAIEDYNNAAIVAPKEELGIIFANRSAALYHLERFRLALRDCDEALKVGYPAHLRYKVEERRARCFLGLKCHSLAIEAFQRALKSLDEAKVAPEKKKKLETDMRVMASVLQKAQQMNEKEGVDLNKMKQLEKSRLKDKDEIPRVPEVNPAYPALSASIEIRDGGASRGRYAVATRDIAPGELVAVEKPHCLALLGEYRLTHCHRCSTRIGVAYPATCYKCSSIAYCSPDCRDKDTRVHEIECAMLPPLWCSNASVTCMLALRAITHKPFEQFIKLKDPELVKRQTPSKEKPYLGKDYRTFTNLVTHQDERTVEDLFHRSYVAAWLFRILQMTSYFPPHVRTPDSAQVPLTEEELFVAGSILHHIQLLQFNAHEISEFTRSRKKIDLSKGSNQFIGGGCFTTMALFNHSCNPSVVRYFVKDAMVVRTVKSISAGDEVNENYGPIFTETPEKERKRVLRLHYWFDCECEPCSKHWPLIGDIDPNILRFKCETGSSCGNILEVKINTDLFMIPCVKCGKSTNILKGLKAMQETDALYKSAQEKIKEGKAEEALTSLLDILKILDETLALPIRDYHLTQQSVRQCMLALGNNALV
ncbi:SET and MYND domain-containing protein 4-like [Trichogramma pretiosum]|uniref:SET and MYND domain-containing protein 4-like n=1 Tax=Trichogramma pretiosum TaxID=7493 RepID=UPI0006C97045|nr:SET and MYND domain-containing protein 4-like [Trichogramma pretiosum]